ncbi:MAG: amidohydrolase family protein [Chitinophagaceae bacterium]
MRIIDTHQHFWKFDPVRDNWITDKMHVIQRDFMPADLLPVLQENGVSSCITVQSNQSKAENEFQLANASENNFIAGVVGWVDLQSADIEEQLNELSSFKKMKGFRHVLQGERQRDFMLRSEFKKGIALLNKFNFTYDILVFTDQLKYTTEFVSQFPDQRFVIDHLAKPDIKNGDSDNWKKDIVELAKYENVYCKISGMITEADWESWSYKDLVPYLDIIVQSFGTNRIMFGSDWPVCLVAGTHQQVLGVVQRYFSTFSRMEQELFFSGNAIRFYNLVEH